MTIIRSRLLSFVLALLACQLGLSAAAPLAMCRGIAPLAGDPAGVVCTCAHAEGAECPMHKGEAQAPAGQPDSPRCCSGCTEQMVVMLSALTGAIAILQPAAATVGPVTSSVALVAQGRPTVDAVRPPTSPPPRS